MNYNTQYNKFNYKRFYRHEQQYNHVISLQDYIGTDNLIYYDIPEGLLQDIKDHIESFVLEERYKVNITILHGLESDPCIINGEWIFSLLHDIVNQIEDLKPHQLTYETGNWNINKVYNQWHQSDRERINVVGVFELIRIYSPKIWDYQNRSGDIVDIDYRTDFTPKIKPYVFTTLNRAPHTHRMELFMQLNKLGLLDKGMCSFNEVKPDALTRSLTEEELNLLPMTLDVDLNKSSAFDHIYGETMPQAFSYMEEKEYDVVPNEFSTFFENSYFTLVTETKIGILRSSDSICTADNCEGVCWPIEKGLECLRCKKINEKPHWMKIYDEKFITEKTWRNMLNGHPMVWIGTMHTAKMLKYLGFKTFDTLWDESYDDIENPLDRFNAVISLVDNLCKKTDEEWLEIQEKAIPILKHNQNKMLELNEVLKIKYDDTIDGEIKWKTS